MIIGCYRLDLYCDKSNNHFVSLDGLDTYYFNSEISEPIPVSNQFTGETFAECAREARKAGWFIDRKNSKCLCKYCKGK